MDLQEDRHLAVRVANGDRAALAAIYDRYADQIFDFCHSMLRDRDEAADAVQQCFLVAAEKMGSLRDPGKLRPWLYAVARNDCLRRIRRRSRERVDQKAAEAERSDNLVADGLTDSQALREVVWSAAKGLPPKDQALLELHVRQGLNGQELADAVGVKVSTVYVMVSRLRAQFEKTIGALLVVRMARTECPELQRILEHAGEEFTVLLRKRVARHIESCDTCKENRRRLVSPFELLAAVPIVPAPMLLRDRVLQTTHLSGDLHAGGDESLRADGRALTAHESPKLLRRTGFPKGPIAGCR